MCPSVIQWVKEAGFTSPLQIYELISVTLSSIQYQQRHFEIVTGIFFITINLAMVIGVDMRSGEKLKCV